jgi:hypothetical protein
MRLNMTAIYCHSTLYLLADSTSDGRPYSPPSSLRVDAWLINNWHPPRPHPTTTMTATTNLGDWESGGQKVHDS